MEIDPLANLAEPIALVVDDEPLILMDTSEIIRDAGYCVVEATSADEAFAFLQKHDSLQLLFTDIQTGGRLDGLELCQRVADRWPHIEIIVASGARVPVEYELPGNASFIQKPFNVENLLDVLREHCPDSA